MICRRTVGNSFSANCVSHITIPHFVRFLFFADLSMAMLEYFLFQRVAVLWDKRHMPSVGAREDFHTTQHILTAYPSI